MKVTSSETADIIQMHSVTNFLISLLELGGVFFFFGSCLADNFLSTTESFFGAVSGSRSAAPLCHLSSFVTFPKEDLGRSCTNLLGAVIHQDRPWTIHLQTWQLLPTQSRRCPEGVRNDRHSFSERKPHALRLVMCVFGEEIPKESR